MEQPTRVKKNYRPAQAIFDYTIQRRMSEQVKADNTKAKADAAAAKAAAIIQQQGQKSQVAALEDAMQAEDNARSLDDIRPDLSIGTKSSQNTDVDILSDSHQMLDEPVDAIDPLSLTERSSYRGSNHSEDFLTGWDEVEDQVAMEEEKFEDEGEDNEYTGTMLSTSETEASQALEDDSQAQKSGRGTKLRGKRHQKEERGKFRAAVNVVRQVPPPPSSKKRKAPEPPQPPAVDGNTSTSTKRPTIKPGGLVANWKQNVQVGGLLDNIACKNPVEFVDEGDDLVEGEFDKAEGPDTLNAVRASKPSTVRVDTKLVCELI